MSKRQTIGRSWLRRVGAAIVFCGALAAGFALGMFYDPRDGKVQATVPVDKMVRFDSYSVVSGTMDKGWNKPEAWGTWMKGRTASILFGFDGPASDDVVLLLEARTRSQKGKTPKVLSVRFNGAEIGQWRLPLATRSLRRRYIIPKSEFNRSTIGRLTFERVGKRSPGRFGLEALTLRDARRLFNFKGHVDHCRTQYIAGWAIGADSPITVAATVNGEPIETIFTNVERPDLANHGLPIAAGFKLIPRKSIPAGSTIDVRFANGKPLIGSPCQAH